MVNQKKLLLFVLAFVLFNIIIVHAEELETIESLGTVEVDQCIRLKNVCANCSFVNITTVNYPNLSQALGVVPMTKIGSEFNYSFCSTNQLGEYLVTYLADPESINTVGIYSFEVTPTGTILSEAEGTLYIFLLIVLILIFFITVYGFFKFPFKNEKNPYDEIIKVTWRKYMKMFCFGMSYLLLVWIIYITWNLSYAYLQYRGLGIFFRYLFTLLVGLTLPIIAVTLILLLVSFTRDRHIQKLLNRGIPVT